MNTITQQAAQCKRQNTRYVRSVKRRFITTLSLCLLVEYTHRQFCTTGCTNLLNGASASSWNANPGSPLGSTSLVPDGSSSISNQRARVVPVWPHVTQIDNDDGNDDSDDDNDERMIDVPFVTVGERCIDSLYSIPQQTNLQGRTDQNGQPTSSIPKHDYRVQLHLNSQHTDSMRGQQHQQQYSDHPLQTKQKFLKTGTTIAGCVFGRGDTAGVVLAADTRATEGTMVADKQCEKVHILASNCMACGAGTSADLDALTRQVLYTLQLQQLQTVVTIGNDATYDLYPSSSALRDQVHAMPVDIDTVCRVLQDSLYEQQGQLGANLIVGGLTIDGQPALRCLHPHGSMDVNLPFAALGSGGLAAMGVLEQGYYASKNAQTASTNQLDESYLTKDEATELVLRAIVSGIKNDLGSGSQVDLCIISCKPSASAAYEYKRSVVSEQILASIKGEAGPDAAEIEDDKSGGITAADISGVNGFGNMAFTLKSSAKLQLNSLDEDDVAATVQSWDDILGLSQD